MAKKQRDYAAEYASRKQLRNIRAENAEYSGTKANRAAGRFDAEEFTAREARAYFSAYVDNDNYNAVRRGDGGDVAAMRYFMVDLMGYLTPEEFDERYGEKAG
jgi:hypothetical protein